MSHSHHQMHHHGEHMEDTDASSTTISTTISNVVTQVVKSVMSHQDHHDHHNHDTHNMHGMHGVHKTSVVYDTQSTDGHPDTHSLHDTHKGHGSHAGHGTHGGHGAHASHEHAAFFSNKFDMSVLFEEWVIDTTTENIRMSNSLDPEETPPHAASHLDYAKLFTVLPLYNDTNWDTKSIVLLLLFTAILSIGYQGIKWVRKYLHTNYRDRIHSWKSKEHVVQTILYSTEFLVSYILMLVVMTYNTWVLLITIFGLGLGYFLFGLHQEKQKCATDCPNVQVDQKNKAYDKNPSAQELMPLGNGTDLCEGCCDFEKVKETDILT